MEGIIANHASASTAGVTLVGVTLVVFIGAERLRGLIYEIVRLHPLQ
jgi:hypothetical protein